MNRFQTTVRTSPRTFSAPSIGAALLVLAVAAWASPGEAQRAFEPADYYRLVNVDDVTVAPDGSRVAFTVTRVLESENERHSELWMQPLRNGRPDGSPVRLTDPTAEAGSPRWSPDSRLLAFRSRRGDDPNSWWFLSMTGPGEAFHIDGVTGAPVWSPDGEWIAFTEVPDDDQPEGGPRAGWIAPDAITHTLDSERFDGRVITSLRMKRDGTSGLLPHPSTRGKSQLFVVEASGGEPRQVTRLPFNVGSPVWSADGRTLFFTGNELEDDEMNTESTGDIWAVDSRGGGSVRRLTTNPGSEGQPAVSPDGQWMAFVHSPERGAQEDIMVIEIGSDGSFRGTPRNLTAEWDLEPGAPEWTAAGTAIRWSAGIGGNRHIFQVSSAGGSVRQVTRGDRQLRSPSFSADGSVLAYAVTDAVTPTELYVASGDGSTEQKATGFNDDLLSELDLQPAERLTWTVADGTEIEGWVVRPVGFREGRTYPLILKIHGGPHSAYGNTFFPTFHVLSGAGFFVLYPNPRGSSNYGNEFEFATRGEWGIVDKEDYMLGVDAALAAYPEADPGRLGVSGGSYGGFMTNWLTATTDRFHAAVTSRSIALWESWWGSSDVPGLTEFEFYGAPWEARDRYRRLSPISYVENVTAPTLIIHSEEDYRTPIQDGELWFAALKKLNVPTELVRYPRSSHGLSRTGEPWLLVDRLERIRSWFVHWLIDNPPGRRTTTDEPES